MLLINKNTILLKLKILKPTFQFDFALYKDFFTHIFANPNKNSYINKITNSIIAKLFLIVLVFKIKYAFIILGKLNSNQFYKVLCFKIKSCLLLNISLFLELQFKDLFKVLI